MIWVEEDAAAAGVVSTRLVEDDWREAALAREAVLPGATLIEDTVESVGWIKVGGEFVVGQVRRRHMGGSGSVAGGGGGVGKPSGKKS